ncbi:NS4 [Lebombo virus]|uniref:NS4 n=1 Tax=Lebombo virus TaxID=40057 RepID=W5QLY3_9REOV|nr:NS4 [Lebombo virus]AFX73385.1 NS4 [Lebombo virus]
MEERSQETPLTREEERIKMLRREVDRLLNLQIGRNWEAGTDWMLAQIDVLLFRIRVGNIKQAEEQLLGMRDRLEDALERKRRGWRVVWPPRR